MTKIKCHIKLGEVPLHLYQILAGFILLSKQNIIQLSVEKLNKKDDTILPYNFMEVIINEEIKVFYDVNDGYTNLLKEEENYVEFLDSLLSECDYYFKRSFSTKYNQPLDLKGKIHPLGLNYMVSIPGNIAHIPVPSDPPIEAVKKIIRMLPFSQYSNNNYSVNSFEGHPFTKTKSQVLFMARLWDENGDYPGQISKDQSEERQYINQFRAECIRACRAEFGPSFFGGISPSPFAITHYKDVVLDDSSVIKRNHYLKKVKESSVCIATMGLHQSIGWKFSEYVAASKAIVTEAMHYEIPGPFEEDRNYMTFHSPDQCVSQVYEALYNEEKNMNMRKNNFSYYHNFVRPDRLVLNTLFTTLGVREGLDNESHSDNIYAYV